VGAGIALALAALLYRSVLARLEDPLFTCIFIGVVLVSIVPLLAKALPASGRSRHVHHRGTH
jgi:hypothetical protein